MKSKIFVILIIFSLITSYESFAQHEGHKPGGSGLASNSQSHKQKDIYYCPMHPSYISDRPGDCPICNMKLVKKEESAMPKEKAGEGSDAGSVYISPQKQQLIGVKTDKAAYKQINKVLRTVGRIAFDPELYKAQAEYIEALKTQERVLGSSEKSVIERTDALAEAAKFKLELSGLGKEQIDELARTKKKDNSLLISYADSPIAWVYATIYEYELEYAKPGQGAAIKTVAYPDKEFKGVVVAVDPVFDTMTRSVRARIKADNKDGLLKPNMYVDVEIASDLGQRLVVAKEAVMDTGLRKVVFVSSSSGHFQGRDVKTGVSMDDYVEIVEGLKEGDSVVTSGNFLIDSESKLKSALEGTGHQPEGNGLASDSQSHQHSQ